MKEYGHFDNHEFGKTEADISFLNGILTAFQFINHKTDSGFDFSLKSYKKSDRSVEGSLKTIFETVSEIKLSKIDESEVKNLLIKWLFNFIPGINKFAKQAFLVDQYDDFSHSNSSDRIEFVEEFVYNLIKITNPLNIFHIDMDYLTITTYVGSDKNIICFEAENEIYILSCAWDD